MKVALWGWNGKRNIGDDAMTLSMIEGLVKNYSVKKISIIDCDLDDLSMSYLDNYRTQYNISGLNLKKWFYKYKFFRNLYLFFILPITLSFRYDLVIIGGGSIFHTYKSNLMYLNLIYIRNILLAKCKIISLGTSAGPFRTIVAQKIFNKILQKIDLISVRDKRSYQYCKALPHIALNYSCDIALALPQLRLIETSKKNRVNIILRQGHITDNISAIIKEAIIHLTREYPLSEIVFLSACSYQLVSENDDICNADFINSLPSELKRKVRSISYSSDPISFYKELGEAKLNISVRLHGTIISYAMNTPFIAISYHTKCSDFFHDLSMNKKFLFENSERKPMEIVNLIDDIMLAGENILNTEINDSMGHFKALREILPQL
ncbi:MAG: hypothetical protein RL662_1540 [Bacteroidota bacterium]|jgi:polysaccharide pyruvyl transferase WcaK-like protein